MQKKNAFLFWAGLLVGAGIVSAAVYTFSGPQGYPLPGTANGFFYSTGVGNAGTVTLDFTIEADNSIGGNRKIGLQAAGVNGDAIFDANAALVPSGKVTDPWYFTGTMTSTNVGTIYLTGANTSLCFNPNDHTIHGYAWNNGLGNIPFGTGACGGLTGTGYQGRVKIIGNVGGETIFASLYNQDSPFNTSVFNTTLQKVRQNVALLSRNISSSQKNTAFTTASPVLVGDKMFFINDTATKKKLTIPNSTLFATARSIIVVGGDVMITGDISPSGLPRAIIALQNASGTGGNVYIDETVKNIKTTVFAEGTVFSGDNAGVLYNATTADITSLPLNQLWIKGSLLARNTVGGSMQSTPVCPLPGAFCNYETSIRYDLNYFRSIPPSRTAPTNTRAYSDASLDMYSVIIDYDDRVISNPPPGFEK